MDGRRMDGAATVDVVTLQNSTESSYSSSNTKLFFATEVRSRCVIGKPSLWSEPAFSRRCERLGQTGRGGVVREESEETAYCGLLSCVR